MKRKNESEIFTVENHEEGFLFNDLENNVAFLAKFADTLFIKVKNRFGILCKLNLTREEKALLALRCSLQTSLLREDLIKMQAGKAKMSEAKYREYLSWQVLTLGEIIYDLYPEIAEKLNNRFLQWGFEDVVNAENN